MEEIKKEFIENLKTRPQKSGTLVRKLIKENRRLLLNLPVIGPARKISRALEDDEFSLFYAFERTLAHKLHPYLYKNNLNLMTSSRIEKIYKKKYEHYSSYMNETVKNKKKDSPEALKAHLNTLKNILVRMTEIDGSFMVIKFCDFHLSKLNLPLTWHGGILLRTGQQTLSLSTAGIRTLNKSLVTISQNFFAYAPHGTKN